jgi:hypothetical protein
MPFCSNKHVATHVSALSSKTYADDAGIIVCSPLYGRIAYVRKRLCNATSLVIGHRHEMSQVVGEIKPRAIIQSPQSTL